MKLILPPFSFICILLLSFSSVLSAGTTKKSVYLPPPTNLQVMGLEDVAMLTWEKPVDTLSGNTPAGLLGYKVYRCDVLHHSVGDPDSLVFYDVSLEVGYYKYAVTAVYDMSYYGSPGDTSESDPAGPIYYNYYCSWKLPFIEPWDQGSFTFQEWSFDPVQGNWGILMTYGNPAPTAYFHSAPDQSNYSYRMKTLTQCTYGYLCADYYLDFDLKLKDSLMTGTEKLTVQFYRDSIWHDLATYYNNGSQDWAAEHFNLPGVADKFFKIGFLAEGVDSRNLGSWYVDNIYIDFNCHPPRDPEQESDSAGNVVLRWRLPECADPSPDTLPGFFYDIYRCHHPWTSFQKIFSGAGKDTVFVDSTVVPGDFYDYFIGEGQLDIEHFPVCEAYSDTLKNILVGTASVNPVKIVVFPSPASAFISIRGLSTVATAELINSSGQVVLQSTGVIDKLSVQDLPTGLYFLRVTTEKQTVVRKIIVQR
ncbi:MAG TPA: T9SS type A sorting domain-containing protein [Bacteroidales bacterium]|nr:T9SS type A sorting domain-containing protein [Bacteroidales bacterium]